MTARHDPKVETASRHVAAGRLAIEKQQALIKRLRSLNMDTRGAEEILARFERSQTIFERDYERVLFEAPKPESPSGE